MFFSQLLVSRLEFGELPRLRLHALLLRFDFTPRLPKPRAAVKSQLLTTFLRRR
jgi:hypothetical protein